MQGLKREEAALTAEIRIAARSGNDASVRILAQQMVRLRDHMKRLQVTKAGLTGVNYSLSVSDAFL